MLTQRQIWRKQSCSHVRSGSDLASLEREESDRLDKISDISNDDLMEVKNNVEYDETKLSDVSSRKIRFDVIVKVVLIPSLQEYRNAGLISYLWCSEIELRSYRTEVLAELHDFMSENGMDDSKHDLIHYKAALKLMLKQLNEKICDLDETTITSCEALSTFSNESDINNSSRYSKLIESDSSSQESLSLHVMSDEDSNITANMYGIDRELINNNAAMYSFECEGVMDLSNL